MLKYKKDINIGQRWLWTNNSALGDFRYIIEILVFDGNKHLQMRTIQRIGDRSPNDNSPLLIDALLNGGWKLLKGQEKIC